MNAERINHRFEELFELFPEPYRELIHSGRKKKTFVLVTDEGSIDRQPLGLIRVAGQIGGLFFFRPSRITEGMLDEAIVHEQIHFYLEQRDNLDYSSFQTHPGMSNFQLAKIEGLRKQNEEEAIALTKKVLREMKLRPTA